MTEPELVELLAAKEHESWARWQSYLFSKCTRQYDGSFLIPCELAERWQRQIDTPYAELSEAEKQSDRAEVAHILPIINAYKQGLTQIQANAEEATGYLDVEHRQRVQHLLDMTETELKTYGNPPPSIYAQFVDGDGHIYRGTLSLVPKEQEDAR